ncbi:salicylate synthase [Nocardia stercoris]|uniref:Salicylate synthase n=1 Tax=Nocardia stercoris TaxID=2483361 RepID=A0A3M2KW18_9NOCA|nr:salicylate synthase [Nocardia stercoris]
MALHSDSQPRTADADPADLVTRLAASGLFAEYVVYERQGEWVFSADPIGRVELDTAEVRRTVDGRTERIRWSGRPLGALAESLDLVREELGAAGRATSACGWIGFECCAYHLDAAHHVPAGTALAHLIVPRVEITFAGDRTTITGTTPDETRAITEILTAAPEPLPTAEPVEVRADPTGYRDRVATAVAEIHAGHYRKVILSRRVAIPFGVDLAATYRLGRAHNTPARSFLLRLGDFEAAGFSPELVAAVDDTGVVTTEPLAGTRAFGLGHARDRQARRELEADPKEIVEHAASVKLSLTEISSVAEPGTESITDFMSVRERGSVQHLASTVRGRLAAGRSPWDAVEVLFPSVTAAGIPKAPGVDAIFRHDHDPRGLYSGAVLTVSPSGALEATLVLRAVYQSGGSAWLRAGAGIIGQSTPAREFEETCEKLRSVSPYVVRAR